MLMVSFNTAYSNALLRTTTAFGKSAILKVLVDCQLPSLSLYLLSKEIVLNSKESPFFDLVLFLHTVACIAPVLNFFSGMLAPKLFSYLFVWFIFEHLLCFRILFQQPRRVGRRLGQEPLLYLKL